MATAKTHIAVCEAQASTQDALYVGAVQMLQTPPAPPFLLCETQSC